MAGRVILTADEMRAAEAVAIASGTSVGTLMERAGNAAAEAIWRYAGPVPALVLCGPGHNGGDGYVIARELAARGLKVRLAASGEPTSAAARAARESWAGPVCPLDEVEPAPLLIDALFGTGLRRPLDGALAARLLGLAAAARVRVAVDLPSGVASDDGRILSPVPDYDLTVTFQTLKPSHLLQPAARRMGRIVIADIGVTATGRLREIGPVRIAPPGPDDHKYRRGYVAVLGGEMAGAGALSAAAALKAGAGYVRMIGAPVAGMPRAVVQGPGDAEDLLADSRISAVVVGPGLGTGSAAQMLLDIALACERPLVLDADALTLVARRGTGVLRDLDHAAILTPHDGEFERLFPDLAGSKVDAARAAAEESGAIVVYKGADTVVADLGGGAAIAPPAPGWLASAGTGDVLTGIVAARRAALDDPFEAACEGVWLHGRAAERAGAGLIADDLLEAL